MKLACKLKTLTIIPNKTLISGVIKSSMLFTCSTASRLEPRYEAEKITCLTHSFNKHAQMFISLTMLRFLWHEAFPTLGQIQGLAFDWR